MWKCKKKLDRRLFFLRRGGAACCPAAIAPAFLQLVGEDDGSSSCSWTFRERETGFWFKREEVRLKVILLTRPNPFILIVSWRILCFVLFMLTVCLPLRIVWYLIWWSWDSLYFDFVRACFVLSLCSFLF